MKRLEQRVQKTQERSAANWKSSKRVTWSRYWGVVGRTVNIRQHLLWNCTFDCPGSTRGHWASCGHFFYVRFSQEFQVSWYNPIFRWYLEKHPHALVPILLFNVVYIIPYEPMVLWVVLWLFSWMQPGKWPWMVLVDSNESSLLVSIIIIRITMIQLQYLFRITVL